MICMVEADALRWPIVDQLLLGIALGFGAGIAPGPLLGLVIASTLRQGWPAGVRLAFVPLISDALVIALCLSVLSTLPSRAIAIIAEFGGVLLIFLSVQTVRDARRANLAPAADPAGKRRRGLVLRGIMVNYLNPHPWLFWIGVGGPVLVSAWRDTAWRAGAFLIGFYLLLVGTKTAIAGVVALGRGRLSQRWYRSVLSGSGGLLAVAGVALIADFWRRAW
jgi:threonine/homoserine/homoserine lactone efflux protein